MAKTKSKAKLKHSADHAGGQHGQHHDRHAPDEVGGSIKSAFKNHTWPASRKTLLAHARQNGWFSKAELSRLEKIPGRIADSLIGTNVRIHPGHERPRVHRFLIGDNSEIGIV